MATEGVEESEAIESALCGALELAKQSESLAHEPQIHLALAALARLRGDEAGAVREEAEAERILAEIGALDKYPA
jgi:hypothetical protein